MCCFATAILLAPALVIAQQAHGLHSGDESRPVTASPGLREQTADQQVMQVLNRLAFGPRPGDAGKVRAMGVDAWIAQQLNPERINDDALDQMLARYSLLKMDQTELASQFSEAQRQSRLVKRDSTARDTGPNADMNALRQIRRSRAQLVGEIESARVARAVGSNRQLLEVMTDFWENHFNVFVGKSAVEAYYLTDYDHTIREHALGKFRDLLGAVAHSPAMLVYLDNAQSRANPGEPTLAALRRGNRAQDVEAIIRRRNLNPQQAQQLRQRAASGAAAAKKQPGLNENYGRELLELHTLGVDGGYTQADVIESARAFTGWSIRPPAQGGGYIFRPEWHDAGPKIFLGHKLAADRGEQDGEDVLDIVARSPATAHFLARQLARRLVSDSPSTALVEAAARTYLKTDGDIREVVRTIVTSPEFFSSRVYHSKVKSPFEVVVSAARALGATSDTTPRTALAVAYLGQPVFGHRDPNGWPETGDSWMNTGAILNRINFGLAVAANRLPGASMRTLPGIDTLFNASRTTQVDAVVSTLLEGAVSPEMRKILMSGEHPLAASAAQQAAEHAAETQTPNDSVDVATDDMATPPMRRIKGAVKGAVKGATKQQGIPGLGALARNPIVGPTPQLTGLAQMVGFALGSPEFQRR